MNNKFTLKELVKVYEKTYYQTGREAGIKAVLDFIGYEFPKDEEREAFDAWYQTAQIPQGETQAFAAWKAGREELRKEVCSDHCEDTKTEPAWIPWPDSSKSPITGSQTKFEVEFRDGEKVICNKDHFYWAHQGTCADIIAYRILEL